MIQTVCLPSSVVSAFLVHPNVFQMYRWNFGSHLWIILAKHPVSCVRARARARCFRQADGVIWFLGIGLADGLQTLRHAASYLSHQLSKTGFWRVAGFVVSAAT